MGPDDRQRALQRSNQVPGTDECSHRQTWQIPPRIIVAKKLLERQRRWSNSLCPSASIRSLAKPSAAMMIALSCEANCPKYNVRETMSVRVLLLLVTLTVLAPCAARAQEQIP